MKFGTITERLNQQFLDGQLVICRCGMQRREAIVVVVVDEGLQKKKFELLFFIFF